jgi:hypothetical protein
MCSLDQIAAQTRDDSRSADLFRACCEQDLEGIVPKWKHGARTTSARSNRRTGGCRCMRGTRLRHPGLTWLKISNLA